MISYFYLSKHSALDILSYLSLTATHSSVQSLSRVRLFATPWITAHQASLSITNSRSLLKLMFIESVMPSSHLILCCLLCLLPPVLPSIRVFSNESTLRMRWPEYWSFSFSIIPSKEHQMCLIVSVLWMSISVSPVDLKMYSMKATSVFSQGFTEDYSLGEGSEQLFWRGARIHTNFLTKKY